MSFVEMLLEVGECVVVLLDFHHWAWLSVLYYSVFMGGSFGFCGVAEELFEGGSSVHCPFAELIHMEFR